MARLLLVLLLLLVVAGSYTAYAASGVYQDLGNGRDHLLAGQVDLDAAVKNADAGSAHQAAGELAAAAADFQRGVARLTNDPALRLGGRLPGSRDQLEAVAHLAAIGQHLTQAGSAAAQIAEGVIGLKQTYAGRNLSVTEVAALAKDADALAQRYAAAATLIGQELKAAHQERSSVTATALVPPLRAVYDQVDSALAEADAVFQRFQDPKQMLSQFFGITLPA